MFAQSGEMGVNTGSSRVFGRSLINVTNGFYDTFNVFDVLTAVACLNGSRLTRFTALSSVEVFLERFARTKTY